MVDVALQAGGSHKMSIGFFAVINFIVSPGQISVMVIVTAEGAVANIHMLGAICEGILTVWVFLIFSEHQADMLTTFLVYNAVIQDGGFASG